MLPTLMPAIEASELRPPSDVLPPWISGASFTVTVYSFGMLNPMTSPGERARETPFDDHPATLPEFLSQFDQVDLLIRTHRLLL